MADLLELEVLSESIPKQNGSVCETELTLSLIDGKWKVFIIWHLGINGTHRFSQLQRVMSEISHKVLTSQLRELINDGLVHREVIPVIPPKVEYSLTESGKTLLPLLMMMNKWAKDHKLNTVNENQINS